ncbi:MAG: hypothetical protein QXS68_01685 [Candidatus Methanomethylicaceae archaeon]
MPSTTVSESPYALTTLICGYLWANLLQTSSGVGAPPVIMQRADFKQPSAPSCALDNAYKTGGMPETTVAL